MNSVDVNFSNIDSSSLLILGNGFDLDLGYPTGYKDFVQNTNSPDNGSFPFLQKNKDYHNLGKFILKCTNVDKWYDLENILAEYGKPIPKRSTDLYLYGFSFSWILEWLYDWKNNLLDNHQNIDKDYLDYERLVKSLVLYLKSIDLSNPNKSSVAAKLLKSLSVQLLRPQIYTFNYTDLSVIGRALGVDDIYFEHIHGNLKDDNIILGVGDYATLRHSYDFLYKTSNYNYHSTNLFDALDTSENIFIFGLSLSQVDYPYFEDFFRNIAQGKYSKVKKYVRIFTYDDSSRSDILRNLRKMNQGMIKLNGYADFDIIRTKNNVDKVKVKNIIDKLSSKWNFSDI